METDGGRPFASLAFERFEQLRQVLRPFPAAVTIIQDPANWS